MAWFIPTIISSREFQGPSLCKAEIHAGKTSYFHLRVPVPCHFQQALKSCSRMYLGGDNSSTFFWTLEFCMVCDWIHRNVPLYVRWLAKSLTVAKATRPPRLVISIAFLSFSSNFRILQSLKADRLSGMNPDILNLGSAHITFHIFSQLFKLLNNFHERHTHGHTPLFICSLSFYQLALNRCFFQHTLNQRRNFSQQFFRIADIWFISLSLFENSICLSSLLFLLPEPSLLSLNQGARWPTVCHSSLQAISTVCVTWGQPPVSAFTFFPIRDREVCQGLKVWWKIMQVIGISPICFRTK